MLDQVAVSFPREAWRESRRGQLSAKVAAEFPSIFVSFESELPDEPHVAASQWDDDGFDCWSFDCNVDDLAVSEESFTLRVADDRGDRPELALEVLNRCQRLIDRRNRHSQGQLFDRVLRRHRALHDLTKPLVRADYNHARDAWQWVLRLDPNASLAVQLAALFHDVERLGSEADKRIEHLAGDYQQFKDAHARAGAELTRSILTGAGVAETVAPRVAELIAVHERQSDADPEVALLNDADALSFFSLNSPGYADYFGPEQTRKKVAYTLARLRPAARAKLANVHLRSDIRDCLSSRA